MKNHKLLHIIVVALAIAAMLLPWGAVLRFVTPSESGVQHETLKTYSYFDPINYGYANFAPFICAIVTSVLFLLLVFCYFGNENKGMRVALAVLSGGAFVLSVLPLILYGFKYFNMTALTISYLLACSFMMSIQRLTGKYFLKEEEEEEETE